MFKINQANWDRIGRVVIGVMMLLLGWTGAVPSSLAVFFMAIGFVSLLTGVVGFCPLYALLKFSTKRA
jgi:hypothetical protein